MRLPERRGRARRVVLVVALIAGAWLAVGAWQLLDTVSDLRAARDTVAGIQSLDAGADLAVAAADLTATRATFERASERLRGMGIAPYRLVPRVGDSIAVAAELSSAGALAAQAGETVVAAIQGLPQGLDSLAPADGALPVARIREMAEPVQQADALLARSLRHLERAQGRSVPGVLGRARDELNEVLPDLSARVHRGAALATALPEFLGAEGPRRYLFLAQNPAEARGTGGFIGAYSILTTDAGRLTFAPFDEIQSLPAFHVSEVVAPSRDYARRYQRYGSAGFWHNINMTPDFPTASRAMLNLYAKGMGVQLDGVIATDPFAMEGLVEVAGPVRVPGFGTVAADEVVDVVTNRAHAEIDDSEQRKKLLGAVAVGAFTGLLEGTGEPIAALSALADAAAGGHIVLRSADPEVQAAFLRADMAGALTDPAGDFLSVIGNSASASKLDYYIQRTIDVEVTLAANGSADTAVRITFDNAAPAGGLSHRVIGPNVDGLEAGEQRQIVSTYAGDGARLGVVAGGDTPVMQEHELGHPVFTTTVTMPPEDVSNLSLTWQRPQGWRRLSDGGQYQLTVHGQTALRPTRIAITVSLPPGRRPRSIPEGVETLSDGRLRFEGVLGRSMALNLGFS